ncbi:MAG: hypothetical protein LUB61_04385 [Eggerthellaceae bacterium]|nr:hypothetical protein [Eggerthellaceae bacterium]
MDTRVTAIILPALKSCAAKVKQTQLKHLLFYIWHGQNPINPSKPTGAKALSHKPAPNQTGNDFQGGFGKVVTFLAFRGEMS